MLLFLLTPQRTVAKNLGQDRLAGYGSQPFQTTNPLTLV